MLPLSLLLIVTLGLMAFAVARTATVPTWTYLRNMR